MAANNDALSTQASAKLALGIPTSDSSQNDLVDALVNAASKFLEKECGRKFVQRNYNNGGSTHGTTSVSDEDYFYMDGNGETAIVLPQYPIDRDATFTFAVLDSRTNAGGESWDTTSHTINDEYIIKYDVGIIDLLGGTLSKGVRNYRITYTAGFDSGEADGQSAAPWVPEDLQRACNAIVKEMFEEKFNVVHEKIGAWTRSYDVNKGNPIIAETINNYKAHSRFI